MVQVVSYHSARKPAPVYSVLVKDAVLDRMAILGNILAKKIGTRSTTDIWNLGYGYSFLGEIWFLFTSIFCPRLTDGQIFYQSSSLCLQFYILVLSQI